MSTDLRHSGPPRFRRALLDQAGRQQHEDRHLQEFTLPVLEQCFPWMARCQVPAHGHGLLAVLALGGVVFVEARDHLTGEEQQEHRHQHQRQRPIAQPPHAIPPSDSSRHCRMSTAAGTVQRPTPHNPRSRHRALRVVASRDSATASIHGVPRSGLSFPDPTHHSCLQEACSRSTVESDRMQHVHRG